MNYGVNRRRSTKVFVFILSAIMFFQIIEAIFFAASASAASKYDPNKPEILTDTFLYAESGIVLDQITGEVLYDMHGNKKMHPASTTKIITLLLALEHGNLDDIVTIGSEINSIPSDSSRMSLIVGEKISLEELMYGLIIKSGNDAAVAIAVHIGGSVKEFVSMMNAKAKDLGCENTNFVNPHGYEHKNHYTTVYDLALIARECTNDATFRKIVNTPSFTIKANNKRKSSSVIRSQSQFISTNHNLEYWYEHGTGIKTGYFSNAKHTFVGSATKGDVKLIAVVFKTTKAGKWIDATRLMEYGFSKLNASIVPNDMPMEGMN